MSTDNKPTVEPDADSFRPGDWWVSPRGTRFLVIERIGQKVSMRAGGTGRKQWRVWDDIGAHTGRQWIRDSRQGASMSTMTIEQALERAAMYRHRAPKTPDHRARVTLTAEVERLRRMADCGSVASFLAMSDAGKRAWFATTWDRDTAHVKRICELEAEIERLRGAVAAEPVAKVLSWTNSSYGRNYKVKWLRDVREGAALYAAPVAQPQPLTEEQIAEGWDLHGGGSSAYESWRHAVEWTERAHGITGSTS